MPIKINAGIGGFESPAVDYSQLKLTLDELLIDSPSSTWLGISSGHSMRGVGINDGDVLVIDRAKERRSGSIIVANLNGEFCVKIWQVPNQLLSSRQVDEYDCYTINDGEDFSIEGVVIRCVKLFTPCHLFVA